MSFLNNIRIGHRLYISFFIVLMLLVAVIFYSMRQMNRLAEQTENMYDHPLTVSNAVQRINTHIVKMQREMRDVALSNDLESINEHAQIVNGLEEKVFEDFTIIDKQFLGEKEKYRKALDVFTAWKPIREEIIALMLNGKRQEAANITSGKEERHVIKIEEAMNALGDFAQNKAREFLREAEHTIRISFNSMYFLILIALMISLVSVLFVTNSITEPLNLFKRAADSIGRGKLDTRVDIHSRDEIGDLAASFNNMTRNLSDVTTSRNRLNIEVEERKRAEALAKKSLTEKMLLMKEVHHRVKNNLSVIQSLLTLQVRDIADDVSKQYFIETTNRVKSMSMIHERLHSAVDLTRVEPSEYIRSLIEGLFNSYKVTSNNIKLNCDVQVTELDVDTMIPLGLIINEIVSNALKYAFPNNMTGELSVSLHGTGNSACELVIKDNGIGLPEDFDIANAKSLGLLIVNSLVNQIKGAIEVSNKNGAEFRITFKERSIK